MLLGEGSLLILVVRSIDEFAVDELGAGSDECYQVSTWPCTLGIPPKAPPQARLTDDPKPTTPRD